MDFTVFFLWSIYIGETPDIKPQNRYVNKVAYTRVYPKYPRLVPPSIQQLW
jgi:hypothetical protein